MTDFRTGNVGYRPEKFRFNYLLYLSCWILLRSVSVPWNADGSKGKR